MYLEQYFNWAPNFQCDPPKPKWDWVHESLLIISSRITNNLRTNSSFCTTPQILYMFLHYVGDADSAYMNVHI